MRQLGPQVTRPHTVFAATTGLPESPVQVLRVASAVGRAHSCQAGLGVMSRSSWARVHRSPAMKRKGTAVRRHGATPP